MATARAVLWVGSPSMLVSLRQEKGEWAVAGVGRGSDVVADGVEGLGAWLASHFQRGCLVDVIYQRHLLRVDAFPSMEGAALDKAVRERLRRDLPTVADNLFAHPAQVPGDEGIQVVTAGVLASIHKRMCADLHAAGLHVGHVGFAGQLAIRAFLRCAKPGCWTVLPNLALADRLVIAGGPGGQILAEGYPGAGIELDEAVPELLKLQFQQVSGQAQRLDLAAADESLRARLSGAELPAPLDLLLPAFLGHPRWRINSTQIPWLPAAQRAASVATVALGAAVVLHSLFLWSQLHSRRAAIVERDVLAGEQVTWESRHREQLARAQELALLEPSLDLLADEAMDDAGWLAFIHRVRDKIDPSLVFDEVALQGPSIDITGRCPSDRTPEALHEELDSCLREGSVILGPVARVAENEFRYSVHVNRDQGVPPRTVRARH